MQSPSTGRSYVLKASTIECWSILLINTLNGHLDWYSMDISIDTRSKHDQQSVDSRPCVNRLIWNYQKLVDSRPTVNWDVDGVSTECQLRCRWSVGQALFKGMVCFKWYLFKGSNKAWATPRLVTVRGFIQIFWQASQTFSYKSLSSGNPIPYQATLKTILKIQKTFTKLQIKGISTALWGKLLTICSKEDFMTGVVGR